MESPSKTATPRWIVLLQSPTLVISLILIIVYIVIGLAVGNLLDPIQPVPIIYLLMQCDAPTPIFPWTIVTAIFLHANPLHIASNLVFLLLFGFILEGQVTKSKWLATFFITGIAGSLSFVALDVVSNAVTPTHFPSPSAGLDCAVGASGAIYGVMGTAVGLKVVILLIFLLGLDIFAGGGTPAHLGGLVAGLILRKYWSLGNKGFKGI